LKNHRAIDRLRTAAAGLAAGFALAGCSGVQIRAEDHVPTPLVDEVPLRAGVFYSPDFRAFTHREERWGTKWQVVLGGAHVTKLDRLLHAMFPKLVDVPDLAKPPEPPLDLILEPRFEEYSFVTPRDAGAQYYAVTIRYRLNLYDGRARLIDSLVYTGYGSSPASGISTEKPLLEATDAAMRDAGAKFATEFAEQATVQKLVRGETPEPLPSNAAAAGGEGAIDEVGPSTGPPESPPAGGAAAPAASAPPAGAPPTQNESPPTAVPSAPQNESPSPGAAAPPGDAMPPVDAAPPGDATPPGDAAPTGESTPPGESSAPAASAADQARGRPAGASSLSRSSASSPASNSSSSSSASPRRSGSATSPVSR
jgi:hypothetical protein